jgi:hypothetical protein
MRQPNPVIMQDYQFRRNSQELRPLWPLCLCAEDAFTDDLPANSGVTVEDWSEAHRPTSARLRPELHPISRSKRRSTIFR